MELCNSLEAMLWSHTGSTLQVFSTLGFLSTGTFQREVGDRLDISQPFISHTLLQVMDRIIQLATQCIKLAYTEDEQVPVMRGFDSIAGSPNTTGATDSTHVVSGGTLHSPSIPECDHKQDNCIIVQLIFDSKKNLLNVVSCCLGGAHNAYSFQKFCRYAYQTRSCWTLVAD